MNKLAYIFPQSKVFLRVCSYLIELLKVFKGLKTVGGWSFAPQLIPNSWRPRQPMSADCTQWLGGWRLWSVTKAH